MSNVSLAATGQKTQTETVAGPGSYSTGGSPVSTDLGRVDAASVETDNEAHEARVTAINSNNVMNVVVVNVADGTEVTDTTDLSGENFTFTAVMN